MKTEAPARINSEHKYLSISRYEATGKQLISAWFNDPTEFLTENLDHGSFEVIKINQ